MIYLFFIILRFVDVFTTFNCLKINCSSELNPFNAFLINRFGLNHFVFINLFISLIVLSIFYLTRKHFVSRTTLKSFTILNFIIVCVNLFVLL